MAISNDIGTRTHAAREVCHLLRHGGRSSCEIIGRKRGNGLEVPRRYRFVAKQRLIKLEGWLQNQVTASKLKLVFLKALTITRDFTDNTEFGV